MKPMNFRKFGTIKKATGFEPPKEGATEVEGVYYLDKNSKSMYIKAGDITPIEGQNNLYSVSLSQTPNVGKYITLMVELSGGAMLNGVVMPNHVLKEGETPAIVLRSSKKDIVDVVKGLDYLVKLTAFDGSK